MFLRTLLVLSLLTPLAHAAGFDRSLHVSNAPDVYVSNGSGHIHVFRGPDSEIHIRAHVYSNWHFGGDADERIRRIEANPPIRQNGNEVRIGEVPEEDRSVFNNITIDYEIAAPEVTALNLHSGSGDIRVDDVGRFLKANTGSGSIEALGIGGSADLHTGSGGIRLRQQKEGEVSATTGSGSIHIEGLDGQLSARTGSGSIDASGKILADTQLRSGSGSIRLRLAADAHYTVEASTGSGSITIAGDHESDHHVSKQVNGGGPRVEAHTGSGSVTIE